MTTSSNLQRSYDTIVIGGGLSGLLIANHLQNSGQSTLIVDRGELPGGHCRTHESSLGRFSHGLKVIPNLAGAESSLQKLKDHFLADLTWETLEEPPVTYEAGFKPFVGFGEESPSYSEVLKYYIQSQFLELNMAPHQWVDHLVEAFAGDFLPQSFVTRILSEEDSKQASGILINGTKKVLCKNIMFTGQPKDLPVLVGEENLSNKIRRGLAKSTMWTSVSYDIIFDQQVCENQAMHVLMGSKDKTEACIGRFQKADPETGFQLSQWLSFMPTDMTEDSELVAATLKRIQKQLKRAYPDCFDHKKQDRILVSLGSHGHADLPLTGHQTLPNLENVWLAGPFLQDTPNLLGTINQVELTLAGMGFSPEELAHPIKGANPFSSEDCVEESEEAAGTEAAEVSGEAPAQI